MRDLIARGHLLDGDEVDAGELFGELLAEAVPVDREEETALLGGSEGLDSGTVGVARTILDLKKDGESVFFGDDIDLAPLGCDVVRLDNGISVTLEVFDRDELCLVAGGTFGIGHIIRCLRYRCL